MSGTALKLIAMVLMLVDHIAQFIPGMPVWMHWLGRISAPVFLYCLVWGMEKTRDRFRYLLRIYLAGLVMGGEMLADRLDQKPFFNTYEVTADGELVPTPRPNPRYIPEGPLKDVLTFLSDLNPGGQLDRYTRDSAAPDPPRLMACDVLFFVLTSVAGVLIFRRKDLK